MTETTGKEVTPQLQTWVGAWKTCMQNVLSQVCGQTIILEIASEPPPSDSDLWYTIVAGGALRGEMSLRFPSFSATQLAQKFLGETEPAQEITTEHKEALEELLRQTAGLAATALAPVAGGEIQFHVTATTAPSWSSAASTSFRESGRDAGESITFEIQISAALSIALQPLVSGPAPATEAPPTALPSSASYGRLLDVGLDVKLRFGTRRMLLRDVLALSTGMVVELDSHVHAPVDLLLDGRVIAQGEVVVVDGKYGLRVTNVTDAPPQ